MVKMSNCTTMNNRMKAGLQKILLRPVPLCVRPCRKFSQPCLPPNPQPHRDYAMHSMPRTLLLSQAGMARAFMKKA
jgi:hypothetical protein